jgi:hypothetical protein
MPQPTHSMRRNMVHEPCSNFHRQKTQRLNDLPRGYRSLKNINTIENHHPDKKNKPDYTIPIPRKTHQKIHGREPIDTPLSRKMREYDNITKMIISMNNWSIAFEKDFSYNPNISLKQLKSQKEKIIKELQLLLVDEQEKAKQINGFNRITLAGILAYAHPSRFPSLRKFLFYCGYKQSSRELKTYNRRIKPIMHNFVCNRIRAKDPKYYPLYLKMKEDAKIRLPNKSKMGIHQIAINRVATFILKEVYSIWRVEK